MRQREGSAATPSTTHSPAPAARGLLCVAPLVPAGGVDALLTAFGLLAGDRPELSVDVAGSGPLSGALHDQAAHLGVAERVRFHGEPAAPALRQAVRGCAVLVLPHRDDGAAADPTAEAALLEALAWTRPVVATRPVAAHSRHLEGGLLVPPGRPTALAQAIEAALRASPCAGRPDEPRRDASALPPDRPGQRLRRAWHRVLR